MYDGRNWEKIRVDHIRRNLLLLVRDFGNKWLLHSQREIAYIIFFVVVDCTRFVATSRGGLQSWWNS